MRLSVIVIVAAAVGGSLGLARTWSEFGGVEERMELPAAVQTDGSEAVAATRTQQPANPSGTPVATVVGESSHDFGLLKRDQSRPHRFVIRNEGDADLLIENQGVSCGLCVQTTFDKAAVKPGEELTIPVSLTARKAGPELNESLELRTNDKARTVIRFELIAYISEAAGASVSELSLGTISTEEGASATFRVYGFTNQPLEIVECKLDERGNQEGFQWEIIDLPQETVQAAQSHAKSGKEFKLSLAPGLPVGPLNQNLTIVARAGEEVTIRVPFSGRVTGALSLIGGSKFSPGNNLLSLGRLDVGERGSGRLQLMVKGEQRDDVQLTVGECNPAEYLRATIGERKAIRNGYLYPITVEVDPSTPAMNRLGGTGAGVGKIVIQTTHPTAKEVTLYVRFAVE